MFKTKNTALMHVLLARTFLPKRWLIDLLLMKYDNQTCKLAALNTGFNRGIAFSLSRWIENMLMYNLKN